MFEAAGDKPEEGEDDIKSSCCSATDALGYTFATMAGTKVQCMPFNNFDDTLSLSKWNLPPSAIGDSSNFDAMGLLTSNKGSPMHAIVEYRIWTSAVISLPKAPSSMGRRAPPIPGKLILTFAPLTSAQRLEASTGSTTEVARDSMSYMGKLLLKFMLP
ncbi:hypothetical protein Acr_00g0063800 [Actinidia rufa]|uniref:Uncharacterized protein n=1 Tax=Actinidia rufa TaxID=165716 RepID=A0A7J0DPC4_9ERIC|nr:hypothetical protein Acr_00g0063800 [Actinidia rufa]